MEHIKHTITGLALLANTFISTIAAIQLAQVQSYASIIASAFAVVSAVFAIRYYIIKSRKES